MVACFVGLAVLTTSLARDGTGHPFVALLLPIFGLPLLGVAIALASALVVRPRSGVLISAVVAVVGLFLLEYSGELSFLFAAPFVSYLGLCGALLVKPDLFS